MNKTRVLRIVKHIIIATIITLCYVHQQVEIVKTSYAIDKSQKELSYLLDQHQALVYNLNKLEKPSALEKRLNKDKINLTMPDKEDIFYLTSAPGGRSGSVSGKQNVIIDALDFLSTKAEAKAK